ncbi:MAG: TatD family hydrolase [Candidatus Terrybacteria bacterium]|nr:TatD family hydrolase [Candidatus Terrybacteria bacterium]
MKPRLFDIHSHLNFPDFDNDREAVIKRMLDNDIGTICVGADKKTSQECVELAEKHDCIFASVGIHPSEIVGNLVSDIRDLAKHPKVVAIGECGLEYYRIKNKELRIKQKDILKQQIELALEVDKPLMIHCRDAHDEVIKILTTYYSQLTTRHNGNIHFFSSSWEEAQKYFDLGFTISFAGPITFTDQYDETIKKAPLDKIMIETDAPFAAPQPWRGKRNEPVYVKEIAKKIAEIKGISYDEVRAATVNNALKFFNLYGKYNN